MRQVPSGSSSIRSGTTVQCPTPNEAKEASCDGALLRVVAMMGSEIRPPPVVITPVSSLLVPDSPEPYPYSCMWNLACTKVWCVKLFHVGILKASLTRWEETDGGHPMMGCELMSGFILGLDPPRESHSRTLHTILYATIPQDSPSCDQLRTWTIKVQFQLACSSSMYFLVNIPPPSFTASYLSPNRIIATTMSVRREDSRRSPLKSAWDQGLGFRRSTSADQLLSRHAERVTLKYIPHISSYPGRNTARIHL